MSGQLIAFAVISGITLYAAYKVATTPVVPHAALFLAAVFVGIAGLFILLEAEFLAAVQVLVYAGAVMTVMVFAVMLSEISDIRGRRVSIVEEWSSPYWGLIPVVVAGALVAFLLGAVARTELVSEPGMAPGMKELGKALFTTYVVPFEVVSVLLLAAMIGAIILSKREDAS